MSVWPHIQVIYANCATLNTFLWLNLNFGGVKCKVIPLMHTPLSNISLHQGRQFTKPWAVANLLHLLSCTLLPFWGVSDNVICIMCNIPICHYYRWDGRLILNAPVIGFEGIASQVCFACSSNSDLPTCTLAYPTNSSVSLWEIPVSKFVARAFFFFLSFLSVFCQGLPGFHSRWKENKVKSVVSLNQTAVLMCPQAEMVRTISTSAAGSQTKQAHYSALNVLLTPLVTCGLWSPPVRERKAIYRSHYSVWVCFPPSTHLGDVI